MKTKRRSYDDKFRASAVIMLEAEGYPNKKGALQHIADHLHVPAMTISRWYKQANNPAPHELVTEKSADFRELIKQELNAIFGDLPDARDAANYRDMITAVGILIDKLQLLNDEPTERGKVEIIVKYE